VQCLSSAPEENHGHMLAGSHGDDHLHGSGNVVPFAVPLSAAAPFDASSHPGALLRWRRLHLRSRLQPSPRHLCLRAYGQGKRPRHRSAELGRDLSRYSLICPGSLSLNDYCLDGVDAVVLGGGRSSFRRRNKDPCRLRSIGVFRRQIHGVCTTSL
jgi:hypothetical protein